MMKKILITEFMEQNSINFIAKKFDITYNPKLCENVKNLISIGSLHFWRAGAPSHPLGRAPGWDRLRACGEDGGEG